jgi:hypothetical protein
VNCLHGAPLAHKLPKLGFAPPSIADLTVAELLQPIRWVQWRLFAEKLLMFVLKQKLAGKTAPATDKANYTAELCRREARFTTVRLRCRDREAGQIHTGQHIPILPPEVLTQRRPDF